MMILIALLIFIFMMLYTMFWMTTIFHKEKKKDYTEQTKATGTIKVLNSEAIMRKFEDKANSMSHEDFLFWVSGKNKEDWLEEERQRTR